MACPTITIRRWSNAVKHTRNTLVRGDAMVKYIFRDVNGNLLWESTSENIGTGREKNLSDNTRKMITMGCINSAKVFGYEPDQEDIKQYGLTK